MQLFLYFWLLLLCISKKKYHLEAIFIMEPLSIMDTLYNCSSMKNITWHFSSQEHKTSRLADLRTEFLDLNTTYSSSINFMHIPKTGGTFIEKLGRTHKYKCGVWGSRLIASRETIANAWESGYYTLEMHHSFQQYRRYSRCAEWHIPSEMLPPLLGAHLYPYDRTFCVFRHPLDRFVSFVNYQRRWLFSEFAPELSFSKHRCNVTILNQLMYMVLSDYITTTSLCSDGCHLLPQISFISEPGICTDVLRYEHLNDDFNALMLSINCDIRINNTHKKSTRCLSINDLESKVISLVNMIYAADFTFWKKNKGIVV